MGRSPVGDDAVFDAVLRRCGAVRVRTYAELFSAEQLIGAGRLPRGNRSLSSPTAVARVSWPRISLRKSAWKSRNCRRKPSRRSTACLPAHWPRGNPVDVLGDATAARLTAALAPCSATRRRCGVDLFSPQRFLASDEAHG